MMHLMDEIERAAHYLKDNGVAPKVVLVLGSGLGGYAERDEDATRIPYADVPGFRASTVAGHKGQLVYADIFGVPTAIMQGRLHFYEGYDQADITVPLRALRLLGAQAVVLTNAAGGVNEGFSPGDLMLIDDHINFSGSSPLRGENLDALGPRFPDMTLAYDEGLKRLMTAAAQQTDIALRRGVYMMFAGPQFETPAEIRFARAVGADAVGMSTVPEVIASRHCGLRACAVSCITNMAAGILPQPLSHREVMETGERVKDKFTALIDAFMALLAPELA